MTADPATTTDPAASDDAPDTTDSTVTPDPADATPGTDAIFGRTRVGLPLPTPTSGAAPPAAPAELLPEGLHNYADAAHLLPR